MKEYIKLLKLCRYGFRFKLNLACFLIFLGVGILIEIVSKGENMLGGFYIVLCSMYMYQFFISLSLTDMIQSSGLKYKLNVVLPVAANVIFFFIFYSFVALFRYGVIRNNPQMESTMATTILLCALFVIVLYIYTAFAYKYFIVSVFAFCITFAVTMGILGSDPSHFFPNMSYGCAVLIGYAAVLLGGLAEFVIGKLLYKKPLSERAFRGIFKSQID